MRYQDNLTVNRQKQCLHVKIAVTFVSVQFSGLHNIVLPHTPTRISTTNKHYYSSQVYAPQIYGNFYAY